MTDIPEDTKTVSRKRSIVLVDIDHTISDAAWRDPLIGAWAEYYPQGIYDHPIEFVTDLLRVLSKEKEIVAVTARPEATRPITIRWMIDNKLPIDQILMRPEGDHRSAFEVKRGLIEFCFPDLSVIDFVLEDRDDCVACYKQMGLNVLQVNFSGARHGKTVESGRTDRGAELEEFGDDPR